MAFENTQIMGPLNDLANVVTEGIGDLIESIFDSAKNFCSSKYNQYFSGTIKSSDEPANKNDVDDAEHRTDDDRVYPVTEGKALNYWPGE